MEKRALITGVTGQDGAYLTEFLLKKGYRVWGIKRRSSSFNTGRVDRFIKTPMLVTRISGSIHGDMTDATNLIRVVQEVQPDEIYNLAAQSHVQVSFETPEYTANVDGLGALRILEAVRLLGFKRQNKNLPGLHFRVIWAGSGGSSKRKKLLFIRVRLTALPSYTVIG